MLEFPLFTVVVDLRVSCPFLFVLDKVVFPIFLVVVIVFVIFPPLFDVVMRVLPIFLTVLMVVFERVAIFISFTKLIKRTGKHSHVPTKLRARISLHQKDLKNDKRTSCLSRVAHWRFQV